MARTIITKTSSDEDSHMDETKMRMRVRRVKANGRERARMHGLNDALDVLRQYVPLTTQHQKLSKIETLRLAKNYIGALQNMLKTGNQPTALEYAHQLSTGLSQTTTNLLASLLQVQPRLIAPSPSASEPPRVDQFSPAPYYYSPTNPPQYSQYPSPQGYPPYGSPNHQPTTSNYPQFHYQQQ